MVKSTLDNINMQFQEFSLKIKTLDEVLEDFADLREMSQAEGNILDGI
jgi:hypothetical protein